MTPEPLQHKRMDLFYKTNLCDNCVTHSKGDFCKVIAIESAVRWLKERVLKKTTDGKTDLWVNKLIDEAFEDAVGKEV